MRLSHGLADCYSQLIGGGMEIPDELSLRQRSGLAANANPPEQL